MNNAIIAARKQTRDELPALAQPAAKLEWRWIALICLLLVVSGVVRYWRGSTFQSLSRESAVPLFPLSEFPRQLGSWRMKEGSAKTLDADIARISGAKDYLEWTYVDETSQESVVVMILYGLAEQVWPHVPDICYPANGYKSIGTSDVIDISIPGTTAKARFRAQSFARIRSGQRDQLEVYHSFRYIGEWGLDMGRNWKLFRYHPGMFKVMVQQQGSSSGLNEENDAVKQLLGMIVGEIERRVANVAQEKPAR